MTRIVDRPDTNPRNEYQYVKCPHCGKWVEWLPGWEEDYVDTLTGRYLFCPNCNTKILIAKLEPNVYTNHLELVYKNYHENISEAYL